MVSSSDNPQSIMYLLITLALLSCLNPLTTVQGQRLSQGASDWYMRFYSNFDFVKRNVERPVTKSFIVSSVVEHRYAITNLTTVIHNPETTGKQTFNFGFIIPRTAFISKVKLTRISSFGAKRDVVTSRLNESYYMVHKFLQQDDDDDEAGYDTSLKKFNSYGASNGANGYGANGHGAHGHGANGHGANGHGANGHGANGHGPNGHGANGHQEVDDDITWELIHGERVNFKQFVLPINMDPLDEVTLTMVYEYEVERSNNLYRHTVSVFPGEIVKDLQVHLSVKENRPLMNLKIHVPVVGEINKNMIEFDGNCARANLVMDEVMQFDFFGSHGFSGDIRLDYDVAVEGGNEMVTKDGYFAHFYHGPPEASLMRSIPMHILIVMDISESMAGPKIKLAKELVKIILKTLDRKFFINLILFDKEIEEWKPPGASVEQEAYLCTNETIEAALAFVETIDTSLTDESDLWKAVLRAIEMDKKVWTSGMMPDNALTTIVLLTDGRPGANSQLTDKEIVHSIKQANKADQIPIFALGLGFDANMDLLKDITVRTPGGVAENIIEDLEAAPQMRALRLHLKDVVLKNVNFNYIGKDLRRQTLTKNRFKFFHAGGAVTVSGKYDPTNPPRITITGQSADGHYEEPLVAAILPIENVCVGTITLCSEAKFRGECITLEDSRASLKDRAFSNRAVSIKISGSCAWIVCDFNNYRGLNLTLNPGYYEGIPDMHKTISSLKKVPLRVTKHQGHFTSIDSDEGEAAKSNTVARLWAFQTIHYALEREENNAWNNGPSNRKQTIIRAYQVAALFGFLTPLTDMFLDNENDEHPDNVEPDLKVVTSTILTYKDLSPIFFQINDPEIEHQWNALKGCQAPIHCENNFHVEFYKTEEPFGRTGVNQDTSLGKVNCSGSITVYIKPKFKGDNFSTEESLHQLYHSTKSQRMRSLSTEGSCCWLLFDHRFFAGEVEKVCGDTKLDLRRKNIGSIKRISPH